MEEERKKKKVLPIVALICVAIMVIALGSYALWQMTKKQTNKNVVGTACLSINLENESGDISIENGWPVSDSEGANTDPYMFTVTNHCEEAVNYVVALESLEADTANGESSDYLDYNYIRVKLDNGSPKTYGTLEGITSDSGVRATKEIVHHTLEGGASEEHSLRLWVKEDTPLQNEDESYNTDKYFYGRVKIIAGQNISGDTPVTIGVLSGDVNTVGSEVQIGDEHFYVLGDDEKISGNVKLLAKYNLLVGQSRYFADSIHSEEDCESAGGEWTKELCFVSNSVNSETPGYNRQSANIPKFLSDFAKYITYPSTDQTICESYGGRYDSNDSDCSFITVVSDTRFDNISELGTPSIDDVENDAITNVYNIVPFANSTYWLDNGSLKTDYSVLENQLLPYVYYNNSKVINSDNTIAAYVNNYKDILENDYRINIDDARLITVEESIVAFCEIGDDLDCSSAPSWLFSSSYWTGSVDDEDLDDLYLLGLFDYPAITKNIDNESLAGVRPVISVSKGIFNS